MCAVRLPDWENALKHVSQTYGFSPVCVRMWLAKEWELSNALAQPSCVQWCFLGGDGMLAVLELCAVIEMQTRIDNYELAGNTFCNVTWFWNHYFNTFCNVTWFWNHYFIAKWRGLKIIILLQCDLVWKFLFDLIWNLHGDVTKISSILRNT